VDVLLDRDSQMMPEFWGVINRAWGYPRFGAVFPREAGWSGDLWIFSCWRTPWTDAAKVESTTIASLNLNFHFIHSISLWLLFYANYLSVYCRV